MADQPDTQVAVDPASELSTQIGASLSSVWARYVGARPEKAETELDGNVVRWTVAGGATEFETGMAAETGDDDAPLPERTLSGFKRDTSAAVAKLTHHKVMAMISKHDNKTGVATETFILEQRPKKY